MSLNMNLDSKYISGSELVSLKINGIPSTVQGILYHARVQCWNSRPRAAKGGGVEYEIASMVKTMSIITNIATLNLFTSDLSSALAEYLLSDERNIELIQNVLKMTAEEHPQELFEMINDSCIEILQNKKALNIQGLNDEIIF